MPIICLQCIQAATNSLFWSVLDPSVFQFEQFVPAAILAEEWFYCCSCCLEPCYILLQTDVFRNGGFRADDFEDSPVVPQVPPPGIEYPGTFCMYLLHVPFPRMYSTFKDDNLPRAPSRTRTSPHSEVAVGDVVAAEEAEAEASADKLKAILLFYLFKEENIWLRQLWLLAHRRPRRWRVRPMLQERQIYGAWHTLVPLLRETDPEEYFNFLRMTPESFDWLLDKVGPVIIKQQSKRSLSEYISPGERLALTLRFLASGDSQTSLSYLFRISTQAISNIVTETTAAIWFALKKEVFEPISPEFWRRKAAEFEVMWQFPMCVGAVDGKHCVFQKFPMRGSAHYNYKGAHSVVLLALCDAKYKFIVVDVGAKGREHDAGREDSLPPQKKVYLPPVFADTYKSNGTYKQGRWRCECSKMENTCFRNLASQEISTPNPRDHDPHSAIMLREKFMEMCIAEPVPWQWDLIPPV
ncbi:Putative nuclease [Frankliniella fusca]|uniref:Nuclease n=1 Tax=Frankliniella fusca TaxID=407009 RepID=A0AAE1LTX6_9NEOP|nr:Putative nuclease [Frankliniella fusca]